jgi:hypothetical protein
MFENHFSQLASIRQVSTNILVTFKTGDNLSFSYSSFNWKIEDNKLILFDTFNEDYYFPVLLVTLDRVHCIVDNEQEKVIDIITNTYKINLHSTLNEYDNIFPHKELTQKEIDTIGKYTAKGIFQVDNIKLLTDWLKEPLLFQQVFINAEYREYDGFIAIDGENTPASSIHIPKKRITNIMGDGENRLKVFLDNYIDISFSTFKCNPNLWTRNTMNKNWDLGRMYLYE